MFSETDQEDASLFVLSETEQEDVSFFVFGECSRTNGLQTE